MQYELDTMGWSHVSLADAALGVGAGYVVPILAERMLGQYSGSQPWVSEYRPQLAAAVGLGACALLYFWRGFGPAVIGGMMALAYGLRATIEGYLASSPAVEGARRLGGIVATAPRLLPAANRNQGLRGVVATQAKNPSFQGAAF